MMLAYQKIGKISFELMFEKTLGYTKFDFNEFLCNEDWGMINRQVFLKKYYDEVFPEQFKAF
jgi:hypothetical protein